MIPRLVLLFSAAALVGAQPNLMPWPSKIYMGEGVLPVGPSFHVAFNGYFEPRLKAAAARLVARLPATPSTDAFVVNPSEATADSLRTRRQADSGVE
jgi:hypothetical protein